MKNQRLYPVLRMVAFEQRLPDGNIFVPDPMMRGRYILTHKCVALVACSHCHSIPGEPCKGAHGYHAGTHYVRRGAVRWDMNRKPVEDIHERRVCRTRFKHNTSHTAICPKCLHLVGDHQ